MQLNLGAAQRSERKAKFSKQGGPDPTTPKSGQDAQRHYVARAWAPKPVGELPSGPAEVIVNPIARSRNTDDIISDERDERNASDVVFEFIVEERVVVHLEEGAMERL